MFIVDEINARDVYCTVVVEFSVPEHFNLSAAVVNLYNTGLALENAYPFLMDMMLYHDLTLSPGAKPLPYGLDHYAILTARYTSLVAKKTGLAADSWCKQFLDCLREVLPRITQFGPEENSVIEPIVTIYKQPAKSFCLA